MKYFHRKMAFSRHCTSSVGVVTCGGWGADGWGWRGTNAATQSALSGMHIIKHVLAFFNIFLIQVIKVCCRGNLFLTCWHLQSNSTADGAGPVLEGNTSVS